MFEDSNKERINLRITKYIEFGFDIYLSEVGAQCNYIGIWILLAHCSQGVRRIINSKYEHVFGNPICFT